MTYIRLDIEVLEIESVLPNVDANDGEMAGKRVLISSGCDLELFCRRI